MSCDEVLRLLREREAACHSEAERLGAEAERIMVRPVMCEQEPARISTVCEVVGELPRIEPVPVSPTGSTAMVPDPAPGWTSAGHRGSGTSACGTSPVCRSSVLPAGGGGAWSGGGAPPDGSDPASFGEGRCGEADGADSGRVVHRDAWHGRGERVNVRQEDGLLLDGRLICPTRKKEDLVAFYVSEPRRYLHREPYPDGGDTRASVRPSVDALYPGRMRGLRRSRGAGDGAAGPARYPRRHRAAGM